MCVAVGLRPTVADAQAPSVLTLHDELLRADDGRVLTSEQRRVVETALASDNPEVRVHALRVIGRTQRAEFLARSMAGLSDASLDVRREAAFAVAHIGSGSSESLPAASDALRAALGSERDMLVCAALAEEYGRLPFASAADLTTAAQELGGLLDRLAKEGEVTAFVELGVARGAEALARRTVRLKAEATPVVTLLASFYAAERMPREATADPLQARIRRLAVGGLVAMDALSAEQRARAHADPDDQVRRLAVVAASTGSMTVEQARTLLADPATIVRHAVASRIGPRLPQVAEAATHDLHVNVRLAGLDALGESGSCRVPCSSRLDRAGTFEGGWHEAAHALAALARTDAEAARPHVSRAAASSIWQVRMYAARAAQHTRQADVIEKLAADAHVNVRHAALSSWRAAHLPGLAAAAVSALSSDDGQLVLEAVASLARDTNREPGAGNREPGSNADGQLSQAQVVTALRSALARLTALRRDTSRDPRMALIERIAELDPARNATLRPYLDDFDPAIAERVATLLDLGRARSESAPLLVAPAPARIHVPTWIAVDALNRTLVTFTLRDGRTLTMRLYATHAPVAAARLVAQVRAGEWNGRTFHRVEPGFVVQGGSPAANEYAGAAEFARDEFSSLSHVRGTVGISTRGPDTGDGQIFVNLMDNARLDFAYTIVGGLVGPPALIDDLVEGEVIESATVQGPAPEAAR